MARSELLHLYGETDGSSTSGTFSLSSPDFSGSVSYIRIPKGMKLKIWCKRISGEVATLIKIGFTRDVTVSSPTWVTIGTEYLASPGEIILEKRRPIVVEGITGKEAIAVTWSQGTAGKAYVELEVEVSE